MLKSLFAVLTFAVCVTMLQAGTSLLIVDGHSEYVIYSAADAASSEQFAACELQKYLELCTGAKLPIVSEFPADGKVFAIGISESVRKLCPAIDFDRLFPDEIILRKVDDSIILTGERPRGSIYAVYEFLETKLGVRFWSDSVESTPECRALEITELDYRYHPCFKMREAFSYETNCIPRFAVKMRNNGHWNVDVPDEMGGHYLYYPNFAHTFETILPFDKYSKTHPEYYTKLGGQHHRAQLCYSNPEMRKEFIRRVQEIIDEHPGMKLLQLSQIDGVMEKHSCTCDRCIAMREKLGSSTDMLVDFLNEVAAAVEKKDPTIEVETLAYNYTRAAPKSVIPRANLRIRLCLAGLNALMPIMHPTNQEIYRDYNDWKALGTHLGLWLYKTNFVHSQTLYPNLNAYEEIAYFAQNPRLDAMFIQCLQSGPSELSELRAYLGSKLLWNPSLKVWDVVAEFVNGFYGSAAPEVMEYLKFIHSSSKIPHIQSDEPDSVNFISINDLLKAREILASAIASLDKNSEFAPRVKKLMLSVELALLARPEIAWFDHSKQAEDYRKTIEPEKLFEKVKAEIAVQNINFAGEHIPIDSALDKIQESFLMPQAKQPLPKSGIGIHTSHDILPKAMVVRLGAELQTDGAARFKLNEHNWPITAELPKIKDGNQKFDVWISAKATADRPEATVFCYCLWDNAKQKSLSYSAEVPIKAKELSSDAFRFVYVGQVVLNEESPMVIIASEKNDANADVTIERIVLTNAE